MKGRFFRGCLLFLSVLLVFPAIPVHAGIPRQEIADPIGLLSGVSLSVPVSAQSAILTEAETGAVLFEKNADVRLPMASTTKIMTALVALELAAPETLITIPREAVGTEGSSVYLFEGEQLTLEQLLWALLLASANDAAVAIAYGVSGGIEPFVARMNEKAAELGLRDTHFANPHGLDAPDHYTTARELAVIARAALENDKIREMVATRKTTIPHNATDGVRLLVNHNKLLRTYPGAIGVKTGFTKRSGRCLVSAAERDGVRLIALTLNAPSDWKDHRAMLDRGFAALVAVPLCTDGGIAADVPVVGGIGESVRVASVGERHLILPAEHGQITATVELPRFLYAPCKIGNAVGQVVWQMDGKPVAAIGMETTDDVPAPEKVSWLRRLLAKLFHH